MSAVAVPLNVTATSAAPAVAGTARLPFTEAPWFVHVTPPSVVVPSGVVFHTGCKAADVPVPAVNFFSRLPLLSRIRSFCA